MIMRIKWHVTELLSSQATGTVKTVPANRHPHQCLSGTIFTCRDCAAHFVAAVTNFNALHISLSQAHVFVGCVLVCVRVRACV